MNAKDELLDLIKKYEAYIEVGNDLFQRVYETYMPPLLSKRKGLIPVNGTMNYDGTAISFRFHGMGCRFEFGKIVVEFDYIYKDFVYRKFDPRKLFWFVESYPTASESLKAMATFNQCILDLEASGMIVKVKDGFDYEFIKHRGRMGGQVLSENLLSWMQFFINAAKKSDLLKQ